MAYVTDDFGVECTYGDFPHGLRCADCHREIEWGDRYSERFEGFIETFAGEAYDVVLICVPCALMGTET